MTNQVTRGPGDRNIQDIINLICAGLLFISPWALGFALEPNAAWTAWSGGVVIAIVALAALLQFTEWEEWVALIVGVAVAVSPWALGFAAISHAAIACAVLGVIVALSAVTEIWIVHYHSGATA